MLLAGLIGALLGVAIFAFARWRGNDADRSFYPTVLIVIASYYVLFAVIGGTSGDLMVQLAVAAAFAGLAVFGQGQGGRIVAIGIVLHGLYDFAFQALGGGGGVPPWWPAFCGAIDIVLGLAVLLAAPRSDVSKRP